MLWLIKQLSFKRELEDLQLWVYHSGDVLPKLVRETFFKQILKIQNMFQAVLVHLNKDSVIRKKQLAANPSIRSKPTQINDNVHSYFSVLCTNQTEPFKIKCDAFDSGVDLTHLTESESD